ncbi:hypothetical protein ACH4ND_00435 [Streptomyces sp. NPDC017179]
MSPGKSPEGAGRSAREQGGVDALPMVFINQQRDRARLGLAD